MTYEIELVELPAQPAAVVRGHVTVEHIPAFLQDAFGEVAAALASQGLAPAGPPFGRYDPGGDGFEVEAGFPATGAVAPAGRVVAAELPGGPVVRAHYQGDYAGIAAAYEAAGEWASAHGFAAAGSPWESYLDGPGAAEPRTDVYLPCRSERPSPASPSPASATR